MLTALPAASCSETYLAHRDTLSPGSGDAIAGDIAKQVIDPWPAAAFQDGLTTSGERLQHAMERYNNPTSGTAAAVPNASPVPALK
ncbi:hypothetical protein [Lichenihabitans sp. Uapishka_5]|uniref:hypothetical protein n=1 Tax=Lichenihabitans sp. Uapishka_5 TaxID=3037302 RepID=UPI0029E82617|nr:hypothetical protein [Lichenihabitans sp. Uapishka_5]